jgi:archaellin
MRTFQILFVTLIVASIASITYVFAAGNTNPPDAGGDGASAVSGYVITDVGYHVNETDPTRLDSVSFTLDASAGMVRIKLVEAGSTWYNCKAVSGNNWSCDTPGADIASVDQLRVFAASR